MTTKRNIGEPQDDLFVFRLIQAGDKKAFEYLFNTYFVSLSRFIFIYVKDTGIAEELALDVFVSVWEKRENLDIKTTLKSYLFQAARNRAINYIRDNDRFVAVSDWTSLDRIEIDDSFEIKELERLISEAVCSLPDRCREIFQKSRTEHLSNKEIADKLNVSVKNVEAQITKAIKLIKDYLKDSYTYFW